MNIPDNKDKRTIVSEGVDVNPVNRYKCTCCSEYCIIAFNVIKKANHNYCPNCGAVIYILEK